MYIYSRFTRQLYDFPKEKSKSLWLELKTADSFTGTVMGSYPLWFRQGSEDEGN